MVEKETKPQNMTAQEKWATSDQYAREKMLESIGWSRSFAKISWKKLSYMIRTNLSNKIWAK
jgi:hypothetical protein